MAASTSLRLEAIRDMVLAGAWLVSRGLAEETHEVESVSPVEWPSVDEIMTHEIGHQVLESGTHTAGSIMNESLPVDPAHEKFSDADIATIRGQVSSPGK